MKALTLYFLLFVASTKAAVNILQGKTIYTSSDPINSRTITDGNVKSCFSSTTSNFNWAVFDLQNVTKVTDVTIQAPISNLPITVYIGKIFSPCYFQRQYLTYSICKANVIQRSATVKIKCASTGNTGQFLAFVQGTFSLKNASNAPSFCEIQATGSVLSVGSKVGRLSIASQPLPTVSASTFSIARAIRSGTTNVTVPHYAQSFTYLSNCQPLIWDFSSLNVFSIACQSVTGNGRLVAFGKNYYFTEIVNGAPSPLRTNLIKWLSPTAKNPTIFSENSIVTITDLYKMKPGDILDFNVPTPYAANVLAQIVLMVQNGTIGINIDWTNYVGTTAAGVNSYMQIMNLFNINFNYNFVTWSSSVTYPLSDSDFTTQMATVDTQLTWMAMNHPYFLSAGPQVTQTMNSMPTSIMMSSSVIKAQMANLVAKYDPLIQIICPCAVAPATDPNDRQLIDTYTQLVLNQVLVNSNYKLPCIDLFPGDFSSPPPKKTVTMFINTTTAYTDNPIGYYLAAGDTMKYTVTQSTGSWAISIGCQSDYLSSSRTSWTRYPYIYVDRIPLNANGQIYSPFGGCVWLYNTNANQTINIVITNVVATPFFNLRSSTAAADWEASKNSPGLWALIAGDQMVICDQAYNVAQLTGAYLVDMMQNNWDILVKIDYAIKNLDWTVQRPQRVVTDLMTSMGYGHSGYPIELWYDWSPDLFNKTYIFTNGYWGMCHEVGHNMQESIWTWSDVTEVTNNNLCLFDHDKLWKVPRYGSDINTLYGYNSAIIAHLNRPPTYASWSSSPWIMLGIYSQMGKSFGWGFYKQVFGYYLANMPSLSSDSAKIAMWINVTSIVTQQNLMPMFDFWGIPIDPAVATAISSMPCFFPNDFWATMSPTRTAYINTKYPKCSSVSTFYQDFDPISAVLESRPNTIFQLSSLSL